MGEIRWEGDGGGGRELSVQTGAIALVSWLMLFLFSEVGGRPVAIYLLALTTLTMPKMPTMPNIHSNTYILTLSTLAVFSFRSPVKEIKQKGNKAIKEVKQ
jgi:hypothetical protein